MSQFRTRSPIHPAARAILVALLAAALGACAGFTPMYATPGVSPRLAAIEVAQPDGRLGFFLRQYLEDSFARDRTQPAAYRLNLANREVRSARGITIANVASRYEVDLTTSYTLTEIASRKLVTRGQIKVNVTYDVVAQPYAALSAEQDGERRAAEQAADRLRLELATFFASPRPLPAETTTRPLDASAFSDRAPGAVIQSPRQQATGELTPQGGQSDVFGQTRQATTTPDQAQPFNASEDPNAIKTLPDAGGPSQ